MFKELLTNIPVFVISLIATVTGGTAVAKVAQELRPTLISDTRQVVEVKSGTPVPTITIAPTTASDSTAPQGGNGGTIATAGMFTLATLATHNLPGNCYVAYKGVVYNVSGHSSWQSCTHHGTRGGRDITSSFPHSTSYFSSLPKVGTLQGGSSEASVGTGRIDDDEDEREDEQDETEEEDEVEIEDEEDDD